jgi:hypothetical protein
MRPSSVVSTDSDNGHSPSADSFATAPSQASPVASIIVPAYNEEAGLPVVLDRLFRVIDSSYEVVVVDDGSTDGTATVAQRFPCRVLRHPANLGKGAAVRTGLAAARSDKAVVIDADATYPPEAIPRLVEALSEGDLVLASRAQGRHHIPLFNRIGNGLFRLLLRLLYGSRLRDPLTGLYGARRSLLAAMQLQANGFGLEAEIIIKGTRMAARVVEVPVNYGPRVGEAKLNGPRDGLRILHTVLRMLVLYNPTVLFMVPGMALLGTGAALLALHLSNTLAPAPAGAGLVLATALCLAGLQAAVFGLSLNLYCVAHRFTRPDWVTRACLKARVPRGLTVAGILALGSGASLGGTPSFWPGGVAGLATPEQVLVASLLAVLSLQLLSSAVYLAVFRAELRTPLPTSGPTSAARATVHAPKRNGADGP